MSAASDHMAERVKAHVETILRAQGTKLGNYMPRSQHAILSAVMDCYEEAYRAGADFAESKRGASAT